MLSQNYSQQTFLFRLHMIIIQTPHIHPKTIESRSTVRIFKNLARYSFLAHLKGLSSFCFPVLGTPPFESSRSLDLRGILILRKVIPLVHFQGIPAYERIVWSFEWSLSDW